MRCMIRLFFLAAVVGLAATASRHDLAAVGMPDESMPPARRWEFNRTGDMEGWKASPSVTAVVMGGALWMKLINPMRDPTQLMTPKYQVYGPHGFGYDDQEYDLASPGDLGIPANTVKKVRMRIINLSPVTDAFVFWRTREQPGGFAGSARFTLKPDLKEWQDAVCHVDDQWKGTIDQIVIRIPNMTPRGDLWIDRLEIADGAPRVLPKRPDLASDQVVPRIKIPGISQADFQDAFKVLDESLMTDVPVWGFPYPVFSPGGYYGGDWWEMDSNLAVEGAKWVNQPLVENIMRGFRAVQAQNPDGRIDLYGASAMRGQVADQSQFPLFFEVAYDVARRTGDQRLREEIYLTMKTYLDWWLSPVKRDARTGLVTGIFEESLGEPYLESTIQLAVPVAVLPQTMADVDTNVAVAIGCYRTAKIAHELAADLKQEKYEAEAKTYDRAFEEFQQSINKYLWNEQDGAYYNFDVKNDKQHRRLICSTFNPTRLRIAPPDRVERLSSKLVDPALFNWGKLPVTSLAKTEKDYVEALGDYDGRAWFGDIWTLRNMEIVAGLEDSGRHDLAAELAWATVKAFNHNFREYLAPSTGEGQGAKRYAWSASQYIQAIIEHLFGVDDDRMRGSLRIVPHIPAALAGQDLSLGALMLPTGSDSRLTVELRREKTGETTVAIRVDGPLPEGNLEVLLPQNERKLREVVDDQKHPLPLIRESEGLINVAGVRVPMRSSLRLVFR